MGLQSYFHPINFTRIDCRERDDKAAGFCFDGAGGIAVEEDYVGCGGHTFQDDIQFASR